MEINKLQAEIHQWAQQCGHWNQEDIIDQVEAYNRDVAKSMIVAQKLALIHSEVSEALEADRKNKRGSIDGYEKRTYITYDDIAADTEVRNVAYKEYVKDTLEDEIAGTIIRAMDLAEWIGMDTEWYIQKAMEYNKTREYKHGKRY